LAKQVFNCELKQIFLFKSGRAALNSLLFTVRHQDPKRNVVFIPDYTCNVVAMACKASGYQIWKYKTDEQFYPDWHDLSETIIPIESPVLVLISMFGSIPSLSEQLKDLLSIKPSIVLIADECQNLVPASPLGGQSIPNGGIVFSFNDKTCPGIMGGGIVVPNNMTASPNFEKVSVQNRVLVTLGLTIMAARKYAHEAYHIAKLMVGQKIIYKFPASLEYSSCKKAHYDIRPEPIYKQSVARAVVSLSHLHHYAQRRIANREVLSTLHDVEGKNIFNYNNSKELSPPFVPFYKEYPDSVTSGSPFPLKAPYACSNNPEKCNRYIFAAKINVYYVKYD
jgi:hypothetical protein